MSYQAAHYNAVFEAMRHEFGEAWYQAVPPLQWNIWRRQIRQRFFDQDILIREMIAALPEAALRMKWPTGTAFFHRLEDVCLKNRRESWVSRTDGVHRLGDILPKQPTT